MGMGDEFDPQDINAYQLADFAEQCHLDKNLLARTLLDLGQNVLAELNEEKLISSLSVSNELDDDEIEYLHKLTCNIVQRTTHLLEQAEDIRSMKV